MPEEKEQSQQRDRSLDTPSEANTEKHINFMDVEEESSEAIVFTEGKPDDRKKKWKEGIEEGRKAKEDSD